MTTPKELLSTAELSAYLGVSNTTLERWRNKGTGPKYVKMGRRKVLYFWTSVQEWMAANEHQSTKELTNDHQTDNGSDASVG